jgi:hypothetical protein
MEIQVVQFAEDFPTNEILSIWEEAFPDLDEKRITWAYKENICGPATVWLLQDRKTAEYFGLSACIPRNIFITGQKQLCGLLVDTAVKRKYRTLGPALKLHKEIIKCSQDYPLLVAFPGELAEGILKAVGFKTAVRLKHYIKVIKSKIIIKRLIKNEMIGKLLSPVTTLFDLGLRILDVRFFNTSEYVVYNTMYFDKTFEEIWQNFNKEFDFIFDRTYEYLVWRYEKHPQKDYMIFIVKNKSSREFLGYIIYYIDKKENRVIVNDFVWIKDKIAYKKVLYLFIKAIRKIGVNSISFFMEEKRDLTMDFRKIGFVKTKQARPVMYFAADQNLKEQMKSLLRECFITYGDSDN